MLRAVCILGFLIVLTGVCIHCMAVAIGKGYRWRPTDILRTLVHLLTLFFLEQKLNAVGIFRKLVYLVALPCFLVLLVTGFYPVLFRGEHLSGYLLMVHATFAPVFAACLAILAVMWAHNCCFDKNYWPWLGRLLERKTINEAKPEKYEFLRKVCFWVVMILALPVILSVVLSMFPLLGTDGQEFLLHLHGYSALALASAGIVHTYLVIRTKMEK